MKRNNLNIYTEDEELIKAFIGGNDNAFNLIVRKYHKKVYWIIRKMILDHDDSDDLTQEVFLKLHRSLSEYRGESKFFTYLYRIAVNYSLNHIYKNKKINEWKVETDYSELKSDYENFDEEFDLAERTKFLEEAIKSLPEQQRAVFNLRYYNHLSYEEISIIMNKSVGGMKSNYFHAIKKIGNYLKSKRKFDSLEIN